MAITATGGQKASSTAAVASLALPSYTSHTGQDVCVTVTLGSTSSSVSSISSSAGSYTSWTLQSSKNGTGVRVEIWTAHVATGAATVFTVNITGGNTTCAAAVEEYAGVSSFGNTGTASGNEFNVYDSLLSQDASNFSVFALGFACQSGDTLTATAGTSRQSSIPAATAVAIGLYDTTAVAVETMEVMARISAVRQWASCGVELRSGGAANSLLDYAATSAATLQAPRDARYLHIQAWGQLINPTGSQSPVWGTFTFCEGYVGQSYLFDWYLELIASPTTFSVVSGALPTGLSLNNLGGNEGSVTGTPTAVGTYGFTLRATNAYGTADQAFSIIIGTAAGGGGAFTFLA